MKHMFNSALHFFQSTKWFTWYFGIGIPPALLGTLYAAYRIDVWVAVAVTALMAAWTVELFRSSCSRCRFYGTAKCGLPGLIAPMIVKQKDRHSISTRHVRFNFHLDVAMIVMVNFIYFFGLPMVWPVVAICTVGGWLTVFRRKRFHGLLYRLRPETHTQGAALDATPQTETEAAALVPVPVSIRSIERA